MIVGYNSCNLLFIIIFIISFSFFNLDLMELKMMMEKLGQAKTHLELKKMIAEVDRENRGLL